MDRKRPRDTYRYVLRDHRNVVQYGVTSDPEVRETEHSDKRFTAMTVVGPAVTRESALLWERKRIEEYARAHGGKRPRYNKM